MKPTNEQRAERAYRLCLIYAERTGTEEDIGTQITDLITDLLHLADQYAFDETDIMERAHGYYDAEKQGVEI